ncbi:MAG TPA: hypothetical protein VK894_06745 [Jiangellales bacterium]|nr:hypothetical protein [Jiangellales bacterium]
MSGDSRLRAVPDEVPIPGMPEVRPATSSGRVRHDEKITVYLSSDELHELELARLGLGRQHGVKVDRGRLVREAVAIMLADLEGRGADSVLVNRLRRTGA